MTCPVRTLFLLLAPAGALLGQVRFEPEGDRRAQAAFEEALSGKGGQGLSCSVRPFAPSLSYDLHMWTGYEVSLPARQFQPGGGQFVLNVFRVTPLQPAGEPVWFARHWPLPEFPAEVDKLRRLELTLGGGFLVGTGQYRVEWVMIDNQSRSCRKSWKIKSNHGQQERLGLVPGFVDDERRIMSWAGPRAAVDGAERRATILVNAYPAFRRRYVSRLSWWDQRLLASAVTTAIDRGGFTSARVVIFDLDRRRVLHEDDDFGGRGYRRLMARLGQANLATIDYSVLAEGPTEWEFLEELLASEGRRSGAEAVIFVSPAWREGGRRGQAKRSLWESFRRAYCIALSPRTSFVTGSVVDFVRSGRGRVFSVHLPTDLASAVERIRRELDESERASANKVISP